MIASDCLAMSTPLNWTAKQSELAGNLVWFSWEGHPRWPGVVVPPQDRQELLNGTRGHFYRPADTILKTTYVRDYKKGSKMPQGPAAGQQKVSTRKVRVDDPFQKRYVLIYSLGDEMYKWASPTSIYDSFADYADETYSYPPGWGREVNTFTEHLRNYKGHRFNGARALKEALEWKGLKEEEAQQKEKHQQAQAEYSAYHGFVGGVATPQRKRARSPQAWLNAPKRASFGFGLSSAALSGAVVPAGRFLEATDADDRYSADQRAAAAALLGVAPNATKEEVRKAFRMKAFKVHPDKQPEANKRWAHEEMARLNKAYTLLCQPRRVRSSSESSQSSCLAIEN